MATLFSPLLSGNFAFFPLFVLLEFSEQKSDFPLPIIQARIFFKTANK